MQVPAHVHGSCAATSHASSQSPALTLLHHRLVALVREHIGAARAAGTPPVLHGAKITGGGCGGTVCILGDASEAAEAAVAAIVERYAQERGGGAVKVFRGSSAGAMAFGHVVVRAE